MKLETRRMLAPATRLLSPGYTWCLHCGMTWRFADGHSVFYSPTNAIFFACEDCWPALTADEIRRYALVATDAWDEPVGTLARKACGRAAAAREAGAS